MNSIQGVEVFAVGTHNGDTYTTKDLDAMVDAFHALDFKPALRVGHASPVENESATPAVGWVDNVRREGNKLIADFSNLADEVMAMIKRRAFTRVSAEMIWNFERAGQKFPRVLKAVALLGVGIPGVAGLKPLAASFVAGLFGDATAKAYTADMLYPSTKKEQDIMDEKEIKRIAEAAATAATEAAEKRFTAQLDAERAARKVSEDKAATEAAAAAKRYDAVIAQGSESRIKALADTCRLPSLRAYVAAFASLAMSSPAEKKYALGQDKDKKDVVVDAVGVIERFIADINGTVTRLYKETGVTHVEGAHDEPGEKSYLDSRSTAGAEVDKRVKELLAKDGKLTYEDATKRILAADPALTAAYTGTPLKRAA